MGVFKCISDVVSANRNELTGSVEDPEVTLRQAIREMETSINEVTEQAARSMLKEKSLHRELERNRKQVEEWNDLASKAVDSGDDDLARRTLSRKKEHEKLAAALEDQLETARESGAALARQLEAMKVKLAEAKRTSAALAARKRAADFRKRMDTQVVDVAADGERHASPEFERLKSKVEQAKAQLRGSQPAESAPVDEPAVADLDVGDEPAELKRGRKS